eukprot:gene8694-641_t
MDEHTTKKSDEKVGTEAPKIPTLNLPSTVPKSPSNSDLFDINSFLSFRENLSPRSPRSPRRPGVDLPGFSELHSDLFLSPRNSKPHVMDQPLPQIHEIQSNNSIDSIFQGKNGKKQNDPRLSHDFGTTPPPMFGFDSPFPSYKQNYQQQQQNQQNQQQPQNQQTIQHPQQQGKNNNNMNYTNVYNRPKNLVTSDKEIFKQVDVYGSNLVSKAKGKTESVMSPQKTKSFSPYKGPMSYPILQQQPQFESLQNFQKFQQQNNFGGGDQQHYQKPQQTNLIPMMPSQSRFLQIPQNYSSHTTPKLPIQQLDKDYKPYLSENPKGGGAIDPTQREMVKQILQKKKRPYDMMMQHPSQQQQQQQPEKIMNSVPLQKKQKHFLPPTSVQHLKEWFYDHLDHPYPSADQKENLSKLSGLTYLQSMGTFNEIN